MASFPDANGLGSSGPVDVAAPHAVRMTTYAHDSTARTIIAFWTTGAGSAACRVARVPVSADDALARHLAQALDRLSDLIWSSYSDPGSVDLVPDNLTRTVRRPNMPVSLMVRVAEDPVEEAAHVVGRLLVEIGSPTLTDAVAREVLADCAAVRAAERGDLGGRAQQGVAHSRWDAPAAQVARAHAVMHAVPLGSERLFTDVEPTAAAVAAIDWLRAAAAVTSRLTGHAPADVLALAEVCGDTVLGVARKVLELLDRDGGRPALHVARDLLSGAFLAGNGIVQAGPRLGRATTVPPGTDPDDEVERFGDLVEVEDLVCTAVHPKEPGRSLLEGVIAGIQGCFEVYLDAVTERERPDPDPRLTGPQWSEEVRRRSDADVRAATQSAGV